MPDELELESSDFQALRKTSAPGMGQQGNKPACAMWSSEAAEFCRNSGLEKDARNAEVLIGRYFQGARCTVELEADPEGSSNWLVFQFDVYGSVESVLDSYFRCKKEWVSLASQQGKVLIRFAYNIT